MVAQIQQAEQDRAADPAGAGFLVAADEPAVGPVGQIGPGDQDLPFKDDTELQGKLCPAFSLFVLGQVREVEQMRGAAELSVPEIAQQAFHRRTGCLAVKVIRRGRQAGVDQAGFKPRVLRIGGGQQGEGKQEERGERAQQQSGSHLHWRFRFPRYVAFHRGITPQQRLCSFFARDCALHRR